jgi:hypothetical protein
MSNLYVYGGGEGFSIKQITNTTVGLWSILAVITAEDAARGFCHVNDLGNAQVGA